MARTVLLARPHPFIVKEMGPFLANAGFKTTQLTSLAEMEHQVKGAWGAVISLALTSDLGASIDEVFLSLREHAPRLPIVFAALMDLDKAKRTMERLARDHGIPARIVGAEESQDALPPVLSHRNTFVYVGLNDLTVPSRRDATAWLVDRHFR